MLALFAALLLAGCAVVPPEDSMSPVQRERAHQSHMGWLDGLRSWQARGRMAAKLPDDALSASMNWRQHEERYELRLAGPFGQGTLRIDGAPGAVRLRTADGRTALAGTPEELISRELGWQVPVSILRHWILGRPAPGVVVDQVELNDDGSVRRMVQAGWYVDYPDYGEVAGGLLPLRVEVRGPQLEITLLMNRWTTS
jgi:outer membrane lipoprotein LolB